MSLGADNQPQMTGDIRLLSGAGVELTQDTTAKTITINANQTLLDEQTHTDTATTVVQRGMLIVGRLIGTVIKWAGLALGAAGKFLKSTGTDVVWGDVDWTDVKNTPPTFPPSAHTHVKADITDFAHTHPPSQISPQGSGSGLDADTVDGQHASAFAPATHTHNATDVAAGQFGANTGGGNYSFPDNVGIGTATPGYKLDVLGPSTNGDIIARFRGGSNLRYLNIRTVSPADLGNAYLSTPAIDAGGDLAILSNILMPSTRYLLVYQTYYKNAEIQVGGGTALGGLSFRLGSDATYQGPLRIRNGVGTELVRINPSGNVGIGTTAPNSKLHVAGSISVAITRKTANYTLTDVDCIVVCDASAGAFTISLPSAVGIAGRMYTIKKVDSSPNPVTVAPQPDQTIDGAASYALSAQWKYVTVVSDGSNWLVIANN
jgi:hypothetical protein